MRHQKEEEILMSSQGLKHLLQVSWGRLSGEELLMLLLMVGVLFLAPTRSGVAYRAEYRACNSGSKGSDTFF